MRLTENKNCSLIRDFFPASIIAGFTKSDLAGNPTGDINLALSFLDKKLKLSYLKQVHFSQVILSAKEGVYAGDALFSQEKGLVLIVRTADCLPLFFASEKLGIVGVVHMGWRSAKAGILDNVAYDLKSFKVACGVGLRLCCYEVGDEFLNHRPFESFIKKEKDKFYFDPVSFAKDNLCRRGLEETNFFDLGLCSFCSRDNFFSFRRDQTSSRNLSFILKM